MHSIRIQSQNSFTHTGIPRVSRNTINRALSFFYVKKSKDVMWLCVRKGRTISYKHPLTKPHIAWMIIKKHSKKFCEKNKLKWKEINIQQYKDNLKKRKKQTKIEKSKHIKKTKTNSTKNKQNKTITKNWSCLHVAFVIFNFCFFDTLTFLFDVFSCSSWTLILVVIFFHWLTPSHF
jgi:hypothetical protein